MWRIAMGGILLSLASMSVSAVEPVLSSRSLQEAIGIGGSRLESVRTDFHRPYRVVVSQPPVDYLEIVTPFRRVVLAAETSTRSGATFGQKEALAELAPAPRRIDLVVELTFHPLNAYVGVPAFDVTLRARGSALMIETTQIIRAPRLGPRLPGLPLQVQGPGTLPDSAQTEPLTGGTLIVGVDGALIGSGAVYDVLVMDGTAEVSRATVDFAALR